jgi:4-hydroxyacetophenone monooxygenase
MTDHSAELDAALADAHLPSLAAATVHLTGDASFISKANWPVYDFFGDSKLGGYSADVQAQLREAARAALEAHLAGAPLPAPPRPETLRRMMDFVAGVDIPDHYAPFLTEELGLSGADA